MSEWLRSGDPSRIYTNEYAFDVSNVDLSNLAEHFTLADGDFVIELADPERWTAEQLASRTSGFSVPRWACPSIEAGDVRTIAFTNAPDANGFFRATIDDDLGVVTFTKVDQYPSNDAR